MNDQASSKKYWGSYYSKNEAPLLPSQFATFVANELTTECIPKVRSIIELGCGNGRDSFFFLHLGYAVHALDASEVAISSCNDRLALQQNELIAEGSFFSGPADRAESWEQLEGRLTGPVLIYTRFFFHAIDAEAEGRVLDVAASLLRKWGGALCVEARSNHDEGAAKVTPAHYRRFIDPNDFTRAVEGRGLKLIYRAEGFGMAKYRQDDAHVFRVVATI